MIEMPEANWLDVVGPRSQFARIISIWPQLVDSTPFQRTQPPQILPLSEQAQKAIRERGIDEIRVGKIMHAPGIGDQLLAHLRNQFHEQLGLTENEITITRGFYVS